MDEVLVSLGLEPIFFIDRTAIRFATFQRPAHPNQSIAHPYRNRHWIFRFFFEDEPGCPGFRILRAPALRVNEAALETFKYGRSSLFLVDDVDGPNRDLNQCRGRQKPSSSY